MAGELTITASKVHLVRATESEIFTAPAGEAGTAGQYFRLNTTSGKLEKGKATEAAEVGNFGGVLLNSVAVGDTATIAISGAIVDLGGALDSVAPDALIYLSDTDATLATAAGTVSTVVGTVVFGFASTAGDRLLRVR